MERIDARRLSDEVLEALRIQAMRLLRHGKTQMEVSRMVGVNPKTIRRWVRRQRSKGEEGLKAQGRGRRYGSKRTLTAEQEQELQQLIADKAPDQLKLSYALWTRQAVQMAIKLKYGITMPVRTVGEYLSRWGFTPQKPIKRAYEQRPAEVQQWLEQEYPVIAQRAKSEKAEIHWGDETGIQTTSHNERGYAPKGKTPVIRLMAKKHSISMISTITNQGKVRFMLYENALNAEVLIRFLKRLIKDAGRKVFLILDNLKVHHAKVVVEWLDEHKEQIEVYYLPSYSPELNPDEYLNGDLKSGMCRGVPARDQRTLNRKVLGHMRKLQKTPAKVKKFFEHHSVKYAA